MEVVFGNNPALMGYGALLGQADPSRMPAINDFRPRLDNGGQSTRQVWEGLRMTCIGLLGEETCTRLLGIQPFFCPPAEERPAACNLKTLAIAAGIGLLVGKIIL